MADTGSDISAMRRKTGAGRGEGARSAGARPGADQAWRLALARAARDHVKLALEVRRLTIDRMGLAEILELAPERGLVVVLEGPSQALGVIMLASDVLAGVIEAQTTGLVTTQPAPQRRPTRTDAAMAAQMIDGALAEMERALEGHDDAHWASGYRYSSFLEEARPLGLLLEEVPFRVLRAEVSLAQGAKTGAVFMAIPAEPPAMAAGPELEESHLRTEAARFSRDFAEQILHAEGELSAVLARIALPLAQLMALEVDRVLPLTGAAIDRISLEDVAGRRLWDGRLGQNRGLRAVRLGEGPASSGAHPGGQPAVRDAPREATQVATGEGAEPLRAAG